MNELVTVDANVNAAANTVSPVIFKTWKDDNSIDSAVKMANAMNNPDTLANVTDVIAVTDIVCTKGTRKGRNGMPDTPCVNTTLLCKDGTALFSQSDGIARSASVIATLFPDCGRSRGLDFLPVRVVETKMNNGNTLKKLVIDR